MRFLSSFFSKEYNNSWATLLVPDIGEIKISKFLSIETMERIEAEAKQACPSCREKLGSAKSITMDSDSGAGEYEKRAVCSFIKNDLMPLIEQQSGRDSERHRLLRVIYFVLRNRTHENWGPRELTMGEAMRLP